jgi:hypothetical protein
MMEEKVEFMEERLVRNGVGNQGRPGCSPESWQEQPLRQT